jgi:hypothetical protein
MLLDHQSACKEHGHTIIIKHLNDKVSVLRLVIYHRVLAIFFSVLQFVVVEITYESIERNLGVNNHRNYAKIVVVNRSANHNRFQKNVIDISMHERFCFVIL